MFRNKYFTSKNHVSLNVMVLGATAFIILPCEAQEMKIITASLQHRETRLGSLKYEWNLTQTLTKPGIDFGQNTQLLKQVFEQARQSARRNGMPEFAANNYAKEFEQSLISSQAPFTAKLDRDWTFINDGTKTVVTGENQSSKSYVGRYVAYYFENYGLVGNTSETDLTDGTKHNTQDTVELWSTPGDATRYRNAFAINDLLIYPEDFSTLIGKNPLAMYGGGWQIIKTTTNTITVKKEVTEGSNSPFTVQLTLDKKHDNIPSEIHIVRDQGKRVQWVSDYKVSKYARRGNEWISSEVVTSYIAPGRLSYVRTWKLKNIETAAPVVLAMQGLQDIADYRLLGPNLTVAEQSSAWQNKSRDIVKYQWKAVDKKLPTEEQLRTMRDNLHPGEITPDPDPGKTSSANFTPFLGGMLCLVGGVWMFKRRGQS